MSLTKCLSVFLLATLFCNVANAKLDPSKYTVTFKYNNEQNWCRGAIISPDTVLSSAECFAELNGLVFNFTSIKAVVGSTESDVKSVSFPEFPDGNGRRIIHDFAIIKLKQSFNDDVTPLRVPKVDENVQQGDVGFVSKEDGNDFGQVKIADSKYCPSNEDLSFFNDSQLCIQVPNLDDGCSDQPGSPLVDENDTLIGIYLDCYDNTYEIFSKVSFFNNVINDVMTGQPGSYKTHNYS